MTKTLAQRIYEELERRITDAASDGYDAITITMKSDGTRITITPVTYDHGPAVEIRRIEYLLIDGCEAMLYGCETLEALSEFLADYDANIAEHAAEAAECDAYYDEHIRWQDPSHKDDPGFQETLQLYSDWYKSLHGRRPRLTAVNGGFAVA